MYKDIVAYFIAVTAFVSSGCSIVHHQPNEVSVHDTLANIEHIDRSSILISRVCHAFTENWLLGCKSYKEKTFGLLPPGIPPVSGETVMHKENTHSDKSLRESTLILFVPGIFGECVDELLPTFADTVRVLQDQGYQAQIVPVEGRASVFSNAVVIKNTLIELSKVRSNLRRIHIVGYSKGGLEVLETLSLFEAEFKNVASVLLLSAPIYGTREADIGFLKAFFAAKFDFDSCDYGDPSVFKELSRSVRKKKMSDWVIHDTIPIYSLATSAKNSTEVAFPLRSGYRKFAHDSIYSDGQVPLDSQVLKNSRYLGTVMVDHWALALDFPRDRNLRDQFTMLRTYFIPEVISVIDGDSNN